jgi:hypothetical protein
MMGSRIVCRSDSDNVALLQDAEVNTRRAIGDMKHPAILWINCLSANRLD